MSDESSTTYRLNSAKVHDHVSVALWLLLERTRGSGTFGNFTRMNREVHIISYFSLQTDLAAEMREWPEFVTGQEYSVDLKSSESGDEVSVRLIDVEEERYVSVSGTGTGPLFDRVLGRVIYALAAHSDNLMVDKYA